jgi:hypothetical protein
LETLQASGTDWRQESLADSSHDALRVTMRSSGTR